MITCGILSVVAVAGIVLLGRRYLRRGQHGGAGQGALNVRQLVECPQSDVSSGHMARDPITMRGDLADDIADMQTRILPLPPEVAFGRSRRDRT